MILGGALGNVYDRLFYRAVPDFIDFHYRKFHWFIFNVADIFITLGVIIMIIIEVTTNNKNKNMKYFKILIFFQLILFIYSCSTIKEDLQTKKVKQ